jgi:cobalt-precorrin 5A hydrolase
MERDTMRVVGLGLRAAASLEGVGALLRQLQISPPLTLALPAFRQAHPVVSRLQAAGFRIVPIPEAVLQGVSTPTRSPRILARFGTGSLAEACALVAAGPGARLVQPRVISADGCVTAALAQAERPDP